MNSSNRKKAERLAFGVVAFFFSLLALHAFREAIYEPIISFMISILGESPLTYLILLACASFVLVYILKKKLPILR